MITFNSPYSDATQKEFPDIFDITTGLPAKFIAQSIEDFNDREVNVEAIKQESEDPFFGENIKEARQILKEIFTR